MGVRFRRDSRRFHGDTQAVASVEFALVGLIFVTGVLNAFDIGRYAYQRLQVENAAYSGAQKAWNECNQTATTKMLPATLNCANLNKAVTAAIQQSTSLSTAVTLTSTGITEGYYCVNTSNALQLVGSVSSKPANCSAAGNSSVTPADYIQVPVTFSYTPLFPISVMGMRGASMITKTSWMRLG
jgi:Flp pilus assembly protein TadG